MSFCQVALLAVACIVFSLNHGVSGQPSAVSYQSRGRSYGWPPAVRHLLYSSESLKSRKGRKKMKIRRMPLFIRFGFFSSVGATSWSRPSFSSVGGNSDSRPLIFVSQRTTHPINIRWLTIGFLVFSSLSSSSVFSVIQTNNRQSRPGNQRYERLWAFPQINAEYACGIRRVAPTEEGCDSESKRTAHGVCLLP